jgi:hypothetical protein
VGSRCPQSTIDLWGKPFLVVLTFNAEVFTHIHSLRSTPHQQLVGSIRLSMKSMTPCPARGQVRKYGVRETGCMWPSQQRHMSAPHIQ